jgi:hypothetical protein
VGESVGERGVVLLLDGEGEQQEKEEGDQLHVAIIGIPID